ncbi:EF hand [Teladorsagia circumcincta]|uniref:EF hand n=1 Tax=Teladorsagia circumcincta TaxID=45464 RepID=A0A2G9TKX0_TELCI|nr:EF hand [Teladorsagia circumcincta]
MKPVERPVHLDAVILERDGELNKEFRQEVLLGGGKPKDPTELREMVKMMFYATDQNNDGALSLEELEARIVNNTRAHLQEAIMEAQSHFNIVDTNKDGQSKLQLSSDLDGDGKVTREEFSASRPSEGGDDDKSLQKRKAEREAEFNKQIDANGDGVATIEEIFEYINPQNAKSLAAEASELIDAIDSDGDRRLTLDELLKQDRLVEFSPLLSVAETLHDDL